LSFVSAIMLSQIWSVGNPSCWLFCPFYTFPSFLSLSFFFFFFVVGSGPRVLIISCPLPAFLTHFVLLWMVSFFSTWKQRHWFCHREPREAEVRRAAVIRGDSRTLPNFATALQLLSPVSCGPLTLPCPWALRCTWVVTIMFLYYTSATCDLQAWCHSSTPEARTPLSPSVIPVLVQMRQKGGGSCPSFGLVGSRQMAQEAGVERARLRGGSLSTQVSCKCRRHSDILHAGASCVLPRCN
jgi:hypothetical protein